MNLENESNILVYPTDNDNQIKNLKIQLKNYEKQFNKEPRYALYVGITSGAIVGILVGWITQPIAISVKNWILNNPEKILQILAL